MARNRGKKALYEVIGKGGFRKPAPGGPVEPPPPPPPPEDEPVDEPVVETPAEQEPTVTTWPKRPKVVQVNAGRVEFSLPYQLAIAVVLGVVLVLLVAYRLGQMSYSTLQPPENGSSAAPGQDAEAGNAAVVDRSETAAPPGPAETTPPFEPGGKNVIVIVEYDKKGDLIPVQEHFNKFGIETEIALRPNGRYFLWTKERYDSFAPGTRGERDLNSVKRAGALYKAKPGYETFAPQYFSDAYGKKVE